MMFTKKSGQSLKRQLVPQNKIWRLYMEMENNKVTEEKETEVLQKAV